MLNELRRRFAQKINKSDIDECLILIGERRDAVSFLFSLIDDEEERVSINALWVITHLDAAVLCDEFDRLEHLMTLYLAERMITKRRLILTIIERIMRRKSFFRADFFDSCMNLILVEAEPYAIRGLSMKIAFEMCGGYKELLLELKMRLDLLSDGSGRKMSPGIKAAYKNVMKKLERWGVSG